MFQLTKKEYANLKSQFATSSLKNWGGRRALPMVFTEHGVLMISSVLNSDAAIKVNIRIMRVYAKIRNVLVQHKDMLLKLKQLEGKVDKHDEQIKIVFNALRGLFAGSSKPRTTIGFKRKNEK